MSDSIWEGADPVGDNIMRAFAESEAEAARVQAFQDGVRDMSGPLGELMRAVAHAWAEFESAAEFGTTTGAEEVRLRGVLRSAMSTVAWLREGEQP